MLKEIKKIESLDQSMNILKEQLNRVESLQKSESKSSKKKMELIQTKVEEHQDVVNESFNSIISKLEQILVLERQKFNFLTKLTTSQSGEDAIIAYIVCVLNIPFEKCQYLDVGANRPIEGSNTYFFYSQGARGVLVEANPELIPSLERNRSGDIIINRCVDTKGDGAVEFMVMNEDGLSTSDRERSLEVEMINPNIQVKKKVMVPTITLNQILDKYFQEDPVVCSIDVEGIDLEIIKSIDFKAHRPLLFIVEMIPYSLKLNINHKDKEILEFMGSVGYVEYAFTGINSIFIDTEALKEKWNY